MGRFLIEGGKRIEGEIFSIGAKNSVLPILAATVMCEKTVVENAPDLSDVDASIKILQYLGCLVEKENNQITVDTQNIKSVPLSDSLSGEMRSSIIFLGAMLSRFHEAEVSYPGGCELGARPINMHLDALKKMGAEIKEIHGKIKCRVIGKKLKGTSITLPFPSVGATENIMLAACLAEGETDIYNCAREPEIEDLAEFLNKSGAKIKLRQGCVHIEGVKKLGSVSHRIIPDRIEAVTYLSAAAITGGEVLIKDCVPAHFQSVSSVFEEMGCKVFAGDRQIYLSAPRHLQSVRMIKTMPYPGFPTDAQAPVMAVLTKAMGSSIFVENIFDSRYKHVAELRKLGADIETEGRVAVINGVGSLYSAAVNCTDLRGGAALVVAALIAEGTTEVCKIHHIDRGYCNLEDNLVRLGASIKRELGD